MSASLENVASLISTIQRGCEAASNLYRHFRVTKHNSGDFSVQRAFEADYFHGLRISNMDAMLPNIRFATSPIANLMGAILHS